MSNNKDHLVGQLTTRWLKVPRWRLAAGRSEASLVPACSMTPRNQQQESSLPDKRENSKGGLGLGKTGQV